MKKIFVGLLVLSINFAATATSPSPEWYLRENLMKAIDQSAVAQIMIDQASERNQSICYFR